MSQDSKGKFDSFSPTNYRYSVEDLKPYLTEEAFIKYKAKVEAALANVLAKQGIISWEIANEIIQGASSITTKEVYEEESLGPYLEKFTDSQKEIISSPSKYTGIASKKAERVIELWQRKLEETRLI